MTSDNSDKNGPKHDRRAIREFLHHLALELLLRRHDLGTGPVPPKLVGWVRECRAKYGSYLLPEVGPGADPAGDPLGEDIGEPGEARQAAARRKEQAEQVFGVLGLLREVAW